MSFTKEKLISILLNNDKLNRMHIICSEKETPYIYIVTDRIYNKDNIPTDILCKSIYIESNKFDEHVDAFVENLMKKHIVTRVSIGWYTISIYCINKEKEE